MFNGETVLTILSQGKINSNDVGVISSTFENLEAVQYTSEGNVIGQDDHMLQD